MPGRSVILNTLFVDKPFGGSLPVHCVHNFATNCKLLFLNQRKGKNDHKNVFMIKSPRKNVPGVGVELGVA